MRKVSSLLLTAGLGTRLMPFTSFWPKCLMPVGSYPLLEYWLSNLYKNGIYDTYINLHHHSNIVETFLTRRRFRQWISTYKEEKLLGTAGTLRQLNSCFKYSTVLLVHADNWSYFNFKSFLDYHFYKRPSGTLLTMMTFKTDKPQNAGIVEKNEKDIIVSFYEKVKNPPGDLANGAVYLLEPEVLHFIEENKHISDFSTQVLPNFINKIASWENKNVHRDIGSIENLKKSQYDFKPKIYWKKKDKWLNDFQKNPIHNMIESA